jgi:hypothetical protein
MGENNTLVKLSISLGVLINEILKEKIHFVPRTNKMGMLSFEFTNEELGLVDKLKIEEPTNGILSGIEMLPNLKSLVIKSKSNPSYTQEKNIASISDKDGSCISKCKNLQVLEIENQAQLTDLDVSELRNLRGLSITRNSRLETLEGLDKLTNMWDFTCVGNESLTHLKELDNIILNNKELIDLNLDILLFPDAIGYDQKSGINESVMQKFKEINTKWEEILSHGKSININLYQMLQMHKKAVEALQNYVPESCDKSTTVLGIEQFLCENVIYDTKSLDKNNSHSDSKIIINDKEVSITSGPLGGANGAFNAFMYNTCVCEGYTRAMQYLLRLKNIKSHNVHCIAGEDKLKMSTFKDDDRYATFSLPADGYHSIISIDDLDFLYDDPCWNAGRYQMGDTSMPYTLLTKEEISRTHTLSFGEKNISNNSFVIPREVIVQLQNVIMLYREERKKIMETSKDSEDKKPATL